MILSIIFIKQYSFVRCLYKVIFKQTEYTKSCWHNKGIYVFTPCIKLKTLNRIVHISYMNWTSRVPVESVDSTSKLRFQLVM